MNPHYIIFGTAAALAAAVSGCGPAKSAPSADLQTDAATVVTAPERVTGGSAAVMPKAVIYRTSAPSASLVPVTVGPDGKLVSYPAPTDLGAEPAILRGGWMLDTRGISEGTRFTRWTYSQYRAMKAAPSPAEILEAILPSPAVTEIVALPTSAAQTTPAMADSLISAGLPGCLTVFKSDN